ncbi:hypothetical protein ON010_g14314 [Phytophthora cinnamomi]|nr:hypothetical protein ON010_g14314 [Phytophthora cinnamomi]
MIEGSFPPDKSSLTEAEEADIRTLGKRVRDVTDAVYMDTNPNSNTVGASSGKVGDESGEASPPDAPPAKRPRR